MLNKMIKLFGYVTLEEHDRLKQALDLAEYEKRTYQRKWIDLRYLVHQLRSSIDDTLGEGSPWDWKRSDYDDETDR